MTLVLTAASHNYIVQTADRRTSITENEQVREYDSSANKLVIFSATDGVAVLGYSGRAYIGSTPTDEWIARILWDGEPVRRGPDGQRPALLNFQNRKYLTDLGTSVINVARSLRVMLNRLDRFFATIAGWQIDRHGLVRPFVVELTKSRMADIKISRAPRHWYRHQHRRLHGIGAEVTDAQLSICLDPYQARHAPPTPAENVRDFVEITRRVSASNPTVGPHVQSVTLMRPDLGGGICDYHPAGSHLVVFPQAQRLGLGLLEAYASPWVITHHMRHAPAYNIGDGFLRLLGEYELRTVGAQPQHGVLSASSSMPRRQAPT